MTDRKQSLQELPEKVGAGDETWVHLPRIPELHTDLVWKAWSGSLDAALALHNAVLPDRSCGITFGVEYGATVTFPPTWDDLHISQSHEIPARAWLLAILRALIEKDGK